MSQQHVEDLEKAQLDVEKAKEAFRKYLKKRNAKKELTYKEEDIRHILTYHESFYKNLTKALAQELTIMAESSYGAPLSPEMLEAQKEAAGQEARQFMMTETGGALLRRKEVVERAADSLAGLRQLAQVFPYKIDQARQMIAALEQLRSYDFINGVLPSGMASGLTFVCEMSTLKGGLAALEKRQETVDELIDIFSTAVAKTDKDEQITACEAAFKTLNKKSDAVFLTLEKLSKEFTDALSSMTITVEDKALSAYIAETSPSVDNLKLAKGTFDLTIGLLGVFLKKSNLTGALVRAADLIGTGSLKAAKEIAIRADMAEYSKKHIKTEVLEEHTKDPLLMARRLVGMQKDALAIVLKGIGATLAGGLYVTPPGTAEVVLGTWDLAAEVVTQALETYLSERIEKAEKNLQVLTPKSESLQEKIEEAFDDAYGQLEEEVTKRLTGALQKFAQQRLEDTKEFLENPKNIADAIKSGVGQEEETGRFIAKFDPFATSSLIAQFVVPPATRAIMKFLPPRPAEVIDGDRLVSIIDDIHFSQQPLGYFITVQPTQGGPVKQFKKGGEVWKLLEQNDTWNFRRTNANATVFPDDDGKILYCASVGRASKSLEVWGYFDPRTTKWVPDRLDRDCFKVDWSKYRIYSGGISEEDFTGDPPQTPGTWYLVDSYEASEHSSGMSYIMFMPDGSTVPMWGHRMDQAKGPSGPAYLLGPLVEKFAVPYPGDLLGVMNDLL